MPNAGFAAGLGALSEADAAALVEKVRSGDTNAWGQLYEHGRPQVQRYLARRMIEQADVEDVVHDTFVRVPGEAAEFNPATHEVGAWLCGRVANHTLVDYGRKDRFRRLSAIEATHAAAVEAAHVGPVESAAERESRPLSPRMVHALAQLTPAQRRSVQLRYLDEMTTEQAGEVAGSSAAAIATNCAAARKRLRTELADLAPAASWLDGTTKKDAVNIALANSRGDVPAAMAWLREQGVSVDQSYVYGIRNGRRGVSGVGDARRHNGHRRTKDTTTEDAVPDGRTATTRATPQPITTGPADPSGVDYAALRLAFNGDGERRHDRARDAACRYAAEHGQWPTTSQLAALAEVSRGTAGNALKGLRARTADSVAAEPVAERELAGANAPPAHKRNRVTKTPTAEPHSHAATTAKREDVLAEPPSADTDPAQATVAASLRRTEEAVRAAAEAVRQIATAPAQTEQDQAERERQREIARQQQDEKTADTDRAAEANWGMAS